MRPPHTGKMSEGGPYGDLECDRCGDPATRSYEGSEFLQLCEPCYSELGNWLEAEDKMSSGEKDAYLDRNLAVLGWFKHLDQRMDSTVRYYNDEDTDDEWVVVIAENPDFGQISYHTRREFVREAEWIQENNGDLEWDGHSREEKNQRIKDMIWPDYNKSQQSTTKHNEEEVPN